MKYYHTFYMFMNKAYQALFFLLAIFLGGACHTHDHTHPADDASEEVTTSVTLWTETIELFAEYRPLVVDEPSQFAAHFTNLAKYEPISEASVKVSLRGSTEVSDQVSEPIRPGIFTPVITPSSPGKFQLEFEIQFEGREEKINAGEVEVYKNRLEAETNVKQPEEGAIVFLKEQAWNTGFAISPIGLRKFKERIQVSGEVVNPPLYPITVAANAAGVLFFEKELLPGTYVNKNDYLGIVIGKNIIAGVAAEENLQLEFLRHKSKFAQAKANFERQQQLFDEKVIAAAEFEQHKLAYEIAETEYQTIADKYIESRGGVEIRSEVSGYIKQVITKQGAYLEVGAPIITIIPSNSRLLKVDVQTIYHDKTRMIDSIRWNDGNAWHDSPAQIISKGQLVEAGAVFIPVWFQVKNLMALPGHYVEAELMFSSGEEKLVIPSQALLEDFGIYSVIVQVTGESFEKREVRIGQRNSEWAEVLSGLQTGERIVTKGAYQVKMASMSGEAPAHGHEH